MLFFSWSSFSESVSRSVAMSSPATPGSVADEISQIQLTAPVEESRPKPGCPAYCTYLIRRKFPDAPHSLRDCPNCEPEDVGGAMAVISEAAKAALAAPPVPRAYRGPRAP